MYIQKRIDKGRTCYQVRENFRENGKVRHRVIIHLGKHPTIEAAYRETEEQYFAGRQGRKDGPLTDDDRKTWDRLERLNDVFLKYHKYVYRLSRSSRIEAEKERLRARPVSPWYQAVLGLPDKATLDEIRAARDRKARECHPDHGGSDAAMAEINEAYERLTG